MNKTHPLEPDFDFVLNELATMEIEKGKVSEFNKKQDAGRVQLRRIDPDEYAHLFQEK